MCYGCCPPVVVRAAFDHADSTVRHPDSPFAVITAVIGQINAVHHVPLVPVDVLIPHAADTVHLHDGGTSIFVKAAIPRKLVYAVVNKAVRYTVVHAARLRIADGVPHTVTCGNSRSACIGMLPSSTLFLGISASVPCIE